jgi:hypothetical protein
VGVVGTEIDILGEAGAKGEDGAEEVERVIEETALAKFLSCISFSCSS